MDQGGRVGLQPGGERHGEDQEDQRGQRWPGTPQAHKGRTTVLCREVTQRCRLPWLTNSALVFVPKCGRKGGRLRGFSQ